MRDRARGALGAIAFLTAVPVGRVTQLREADLRRGVVLFPLVGGAVGGIVALVTWSAAVVLPAIPAATLGVAAGIVVTAAFHLDGLGDVADALGGRDPHQAMRDPRLGTFGVAGVTLDLLLKVSVVASLATSRFPWAIVAAASVARVAPVALAWRLPYVGGGTGGWTADIGARSVVAALVVAGVVVVPTVGAFGTALMLVVVGASVVGLGRWSRRRLGGVTGDVFGASAELGETLALAVALAGPA